MGGNSGQSPAPTAELCFGLLSRLSAMSNNAVVTVIDDDSAARQSLVFLLSAAGIAVRTFESATSFLKASPTLHGGSTPHGTSTPSSKRPDTVGEVLRP